MCSVGSNGCASTETLILMMILLRRTTEMMMLFSSKDPLSFVTKRESGILNIFMGLVIINIVFARLSFNV